MKNIVSTRYLNQTKLEKKPNYEEIIDIVQPDVRVHVPQRKATDQYKSHFNLVYSNLSDERIKDMEKQMLLEKFSNHYGLNASAVAAYTSANDLVPVPAPTGGGGHEGGGGGAGVIHPGFVASLLGGVAGFVGFGGGGSSAAKAAPPQPPPPAAPASASAPRPPPPPPPSAGGAVFDLATPPASPNDNPLAFMFEHVPKSHPSTLLGKNQSQLDYESQHDTVMSMSEYAALQHQLAEQLPHQQPHTQIQAFDLFTSHAPVGATPLFPESVHSSSRSASEYGEQSDGTFEDVKTEMVRVVGQKNDGSAYTDADYGAAIVAITTGSRARAQHGQSEEVREAAQHLADRINKTHPQMNRRGFHDIIISDEYREFVKSMDAKKFNQSELEAHGSNILAEYRHSNPEVMRALGDLPHTKSIMASVPKGRGTPFRSPFQAAGYSSSSGSAGPQPLPMPAAKPKGRAPKP